MSDAPRMSREKPGEASVRPRAHLEHDRGALEAERLPELVLQVALVGEVQVHGWFRESTKVGGETPIWVP